MSGGKSSKSTKAPPIITEKSLLEAKDANGTWYPVKVLSVKDDKVHVHFCNWSSRFDTWYPLNSDCLRPMKRPNAGSSGTHSSSPTPLKSSKTEPERAGTPPQFEVGSFVMAAWRNQYEYLAEVIGRRQRHGVKSEYKLRYVWDHVVEWTPASRLRKATQFEIDYVFKFCAEHGDTAASKNKVAVTPKNRPTELLSKKANSSEGGSVSTRSQSKKQETDPIGSTSDSRPSAPRPSISRTDQKVDRGPNVDDSEKDGDMVYDKAVLQFHEACKRRRELKRQAAQAERVAEMPKSVVSKSSESVCSTPDHLVSETLIKPEVMDERVQKPAKVPRICGTSDSNHSENVPEAVKTSGVRSDVSVSASSAVPVTTASSSVVSSGASTESKSQTKIPPKSLVMSVPDSTPRPNSLSTPTNVNPKPGTEHSSSAPVIYPCPYCPRYLRHSKLLAAHITNYHKDASTSSTPVPSRKGNVHPSSSAATRPTQETKPPTLIPSADITSKKSNQRSTALKTTDGGHRLLTCHRCDTCTYVSDKNLQLIQCESCLCWAHRSCYGLMRDSRKLPSAAPESENQDAGFLCDGCLLNGWRKRTSRVNECQDDWLYTGHLPWENSNADPNARRLLAETSELLNWTYQLRPLLGAGWKLLNATKLAHSAAVRKTHPRPCVRPLTSEGGSEENATDKHVKHMSGPPESNVSELQNGDDQVNRLYMELRGIALGPTTVNNPGTSQNSMVDGTFVTPNDNECSTTWTLNDEVPDNAYSSTVYSADPLVPSVDPNEVISNHVLTGFLQDLGPNVLPEITDLSGDAMIGESEAHEADVDYFLGPQTSERQPDPHGASRPCSLSLPTSATNTPTKGLGSLVSSPAETVTALQAAFSNPVTLSKYPEEQSVDRGSLHDQLLVPESPLYASSVKAPGGSSSPADQEEIEPNQTSETPKPEASDACTSFHSASAVSDFLDDSLTDGLPTSISELPQTPAKILCAFNRGPQPTEGSTIPCDTRLTVADMDWLNVDSAAVPPTSVNNLPFNSVPSPKLTSKDPSLSLYEDLGTGVPFSLDALTVDALTVDDVERQTKARKNLDQLDECVLTPLENTLSLMEAQLDSLTAELIVLEQAHSAGLKKSEGDNFHGSHELHIPEDELIINSDIFPAKSDSSSPFSSSSSSFSLSPARQPIDELAISAKMMDTNPSPHSGLIRDSLPHCVSPIPTSQHSGCFQSTKFAARQLYRLALSNRTASEISSGNPPPR
ncbi:unnamed protein product [Calicophoron daubneyi]|uniref:C2H2-type domain-containing protein n=1 Tax=Calicophoron daubneyi TaxID=300641 RepID=A0AAV2TP35_CALDB